MHELELLKDLVVVFGCAGGVVYLFHRLNQSPIVGFVVSGMLIGPSGLSLINDVGSVNTLATVGVMILLFSLGLEFSLRKLMETRVAVLVTGPLQMALTIVPVSAIAVYLGTPMSAAILFGTLIAVNSTTVLMKLLAERGEVDSVHGRIGLGVSIFQDLCTIPMLVAIPLLARGGAGLLPVVAVGLAKAIAVIAAVVVVARYVFPVVLAGVLRTRSKELFLITAVFMFFGTAWFTSKAGISLALGAFLAGLVLSESEFGHQIFAEVRPVRDSLNSLFFISLGMLAEPRFIGLHLWTIMGTTVAILAGKSALTAAAVWLTRFPIQIGVLSGVAMAHVGEFSFVLLQAGAAAGLVGSGAYQLILASSLITMVAAPIAFAFTRKAVSRVEWQPPRRLRAIAGAESASEARPLRDHVIICGFGVGGRNIASILKANRISYVLLDLSTKILREARAHGEPILFGDCTSSHILRTAGCQHARVIVFVISDPYATRVAIAEARQLNPEIVILTRTKRVSDMDDLWDQGSTEVIAEEFEASLELITRILRVYNAPRAMVAAEIKSIRDQRFGIFRERETTVPRIRLSSEIDVYTETWDVPQDCPWHGATVAETRLRGETGTLILGIIRGGRTLNNPQPDERILCGDRLVLTGTKTQLGKAIDMLAGHKKQP